MRLGQKRFQAIQSGRGSVRAEIAPGAMVLGNCGFTIAPCKPADRDLTMRHLIHVEGMSLDALRAGIRWEFESFPQYLDMLQRQGVGPNVVS